MSDDRATSAWESEGGYVPSNGPGDPVALTCWIVSDRVNAGEAGRSGMACLPSCVAPSWFATRGSAPPTALEKSSRLPSFKCV